MRHHLMVDVVIAFGELYGTIERKHAPVGGVVEDHQLLKIRLLVMDQPIDAKALAVAVVQVFEKNLSMIPL